LRTRTILTILVRTAALAAAANHFVVKSFFSLSLFSPADKMDDVDIRTYLGQENPENDDFNAKSSMMSFMRDQSSWNTGALC
jgi:hypothetical protein